ncbi:hypothetical protein A1O3_00861 [Capronia epimyces CBS 606.96]|uniref:Zn(2)-C6 fungal-type domain-containing protein n=1 Tax=Capronia epimyces CBS 606.96 TaxID=1182542 RepID=W9YSS1_9EURO|nr:uncharacterized protein A1O3_00861 [Capronia epimyces CBS 606.96]EXJ92311.1 hypothetical protein A1O3_00861 [Capronia epimyces CBS 606.96]
MALQGAGLQIPDARDRDRSKLIKRRKVTIACEQCRERKRKCDGVRPLCGSCARRQPPSKCVWSQERWRHIPALEALDARIKQLEASRPGTSETSASDSSLPLSQVNEGSVPSRTTMTTSHRRRPVQPGPWQEGAFPPARPQPEPHGYGEVDTARKADPHKLSIQSMLSTENNMEQASESSRVDAMGTTSAFIARSESTEHPGSAFFGPSSTSSFLGVVRLIIGRSSNVPGRTPPSQHTAESRSSNLCSATSSHVSPEQDLGWKYSSSVFELPPRGEADMLVANYFTWVYSLYPIIHRPYFNARYERLWQRPHMHASPITLEDILFHCMLNAILALGTQFHPELEPHSRVSKSELFFAHCQQLLTLDLFAHSDFMTVQCLLLMCYFLLSTDKPDYCWNLSGLALRMAQAIGLHIDSADDCSQTGSRRDQVDVELQRRVWGGCCLLDRSLSFLYGRPLMMYPHLTSQFVFPSLIDDEYLTRLPDPPGSQPEGIPSVMATWSHCLRLGEILGEIISTFYQGNQSSISTLGDIKLGRDFGNPSLFSRLKQGDFKDLFTLDARLHDWYEQLPAYLKISSNPDPGMPGDGGGGGGGYQSHWDYCFSSTSTSLGPSPATDGSSGPSPSGHYGEANIPKIRNFQREANVLKARWLHVRVFLSRPALLVILDRDQYAFTFGYNEDTYLSRSVLHLRMLSSLADLCVSAAQDLVDLVYNNCPSEHKLLHVWWYSVCCKDSDTTPS